jgi:UDP-N-acetylmuramoyl-tripeptide--D-alanyl-D-alanine ligase
MLSKFNISVIANKAKAELHGKSIEVNGFSIDTRTLSNGDLYIALKGKNFNGTDFINEAITKGANAIVADHYFKSKVPLLVVDDTETFLKNLAIMNRLAFKGPVVGITGSNGKTSSKEIVASLLSSKKKCHKTIGNKNNQIGLPFSLADLDSSYDCSILELGTSFPGEIGILSAIAKPDIALITNVSESHLSGLGSLELIAKEKGDIGCFENDQGVLVLNKDSRYFGFWCNTTNANKVISFGAKEGCDFQVLSTDVDFNKNLTSFVLVHQNKEFKCTMNGVGLHNSVNAAGALAVCSGMGLALDEIIDNLERIELPQRRLSLFRISNGSLLIDDSYNANPESVKQSIDTMCVSGMNKKIVVLGEMGELGNDAAKLHKEISEYAKTRVDNFLCLGNSWQEGVKLFGEKGIVFSSQEELVDHVSSILETDTVILVKGSRSTRMDIVADKLKEF